METFTPRTVQQGAVFLDRNLPGWERYINLDELSMTSPWGCVLAQLQTEHPRLRCMQITAGSPWEAALVALGLNSGSVFADFDGEWADAVKARLDQPPVRDLAVDA